MMTNLVHMTAAYSNAVLVAILPYVSEFGKKLHLDIPEPLTPSQVTWFHPPPLKDSIAAGLVLSNHYWFGFDHGAVIAFRSAEDPFCDQDPPGNLPKYGFGKDNMTTNEAIEMARIALRNLGYKPEELHADGPPTDLRGPFDFPDGHHVPHCRVEWEKDWGTNPPTGDLPGGSALHIDINLDKKIVTGLSIVSARTRRPSPKVDVVPELESDYRKRMKPSMGKMITRTNAPPRFIRPKPPSEDHD
jgi:hypothetical protein